MYGTIIGRIGSDAVLKATPKGTPVLEFSVVENAWAGEEKSTWYKCSCFGKKAEKLENLLKKGAAVSVIGQSYNDSWVNEMNETKYTLRCSVQDVKIQQYADDGPRRSSPAPQSNYSTAPTHNPPSAGGAPTKRFEDDVPF